MTPDRALSVGSAPHVASTPAVTRPWSLLQVGVTSFFFGPLAGGILTAINFRRLGRPERSRAWTVLSIALSVLLVLAFVAAVQVVPEGYRFWLKVLCLYLVAATYVHVQERDVDQWIEQHVPREQRAYYSGGRTALLLGIGVLCLAVQAGLTYVFYGLLYQ